MAHNLGISDAAAQKRVSRAVERLRELFAERGVAIGAGGLVILISSMRAETIAPPSFPKVASRIRPRQINHG